MPPLDTKLLSTVEAAKVANVTSGYITRLCRSKKLAGVRMGRNWFVEPAALDAYLKEVQLQKEQIRQELAKQREDEYRRMVGASHGLMGTRTRMPRIARSWAGAPTTSIGAVSAPAPARAAALHPAFGGSMLARSTVAAVCILSTLYVGASAVRMQEVDGLAGLPQADARTTAAAANAGTGNFAEQLALGTYHLINALIGGILGPHAPQSVVATTAPAPSAPTAPAVPGAASSSASLPPASDFPPLPPVPPAPEPGAAIAANNSTQPPTYQGGTIVRNITYVTNNFSYANDVVSRSAFNGSLDNFSSSIVPIPASTYASQLTGNGLVADNGVLNVATSSLASGFFLQGGNSLGATSTLGTLDAEPLQFLTNATPQLTIDTSGNVGIGTTSPSVALQVGGIGAIGVPYGTSAQRPTGVLGLLRFNTTTSQYEGYNGSTWAGLGGVTDVNQDTYILAESAPGANEDTLYFYTDGSEKLRILPTGEVGIGTTSPSATLAVNGNGYISGSLTVGNSLTIQNGSISLGSATSTLVLNGYVGSSIVPEINKTYDLGSPALFWRNAYVDSLTVNTLGAASTTISGTASNAFTINSDNATVDTEDSSLIFFRGVVNPNAVLTWNSATERFEFNQPGLFWNQSSTTTIPSLIARAATSQTADLFQAQDSSGNVLTNITSAGFIGIGTTTPANAIEIKTASSDARIGAGGENFYRQNGSLRFSGFNLGGIGFGGSDDNFNTVKTGASISSRSEGTGAFQYSQGASPSPVSNLFFNTTSNGASGPLPRLWIDSTGYVGIGDFNDGQDTPTGILPTNQLQVRLSSQSTAKSADFSTLYLDNSATSTTSNVIKSGLRLSSTGTWTGSGASNIGLYVTSVTGGTNNYDAIFNGGGNVGIGTTSPGTRLDVFSSTTNAVVRANNNAATFFERFTALGENANSYVALTHNNSGTGNSTLLDIPLSANIQTGSGDTGGLVLDTQASAPIIFGTGGGGTGKERLRIDGTTGNVGIGTTSPAAALSVTGAGLFTGNLTAQGNNFSAAANTLTAAWTGGTTVTVGGSANTNNTLDFLNTTSGTINGRNSITLSHGNSVSPSVGLTAYYNGNTTANGVGVTGEDFDITAGTPTYFGTFTSDPVTLYTGGTPRISIAGAGNVGIGSSSPAFPLSVGGNAYVQGTITQLGPTNGTLINISRNTNANGYAEHDFLNDRNVSTSEAFIGYTGSTYGGFGGMTGEFGYVGTGGNFPFTIDTNSTSRVTITGAGNVGIGTTSPMSKLSISGLGGGTQYLNYGGTGTGYSNTSGGVLELSDYFGTNPWGIFTDNGGKFDIQRKNDTQPELTLIGATGSVGIGSTTPWGTLSVVGGSATTPVLTARSTLNSGNLVNLLYLSAGNLDGVFTVNDQGNVTARGSLNVNYSGGNIGNTQITAPSSFAQLAMFDNNGTAKVNLSTNAASYFNGGNVGIGTSTPTSLLSLASVSNAVISIADKTTGGANGSGYLSFSGHGDGTQLWAIGHDAVDYAQDTFLIARGSTLASNPALAISGTTGNIGIATTSPQYLLTLDASTGVGTSLAIDVQRLGTDEFTVNRTGAVFASGGYGGGIGGNYYGLTDRALLLGGTDVPTYGAVYRGSPDSNSLYLGYGSSYTNVVTTKNVGIGTTTPANLLTVSATPYATTSTSLLSAASSGTTALTVEGAASQTVPLQQWLDSSGNILAQINPRVSQGNATIFTVNPSKQLIQSDIATFYGFLSSAVDIAQSGTPSLNTGISSPSLQLTGLWNNGGTVVNNYAGITYTPTTATGNGYLSFGAGNSNSGQLTLYRFENRTASLEVGTSTIAAGLGSAQLIVQPSFTGREGISIIGNSGQTANFIDAMDSNYNPLFVVSGAGNVGIGTTSPASPLSVNGATYIAAPNGTGIGLLLSGGGASLAGAIQQTNGAETWLTGVGGGNNAYVNGSGWFLRDATAGATRIGVDTSGRVGIGTSSPVFTLDVAGKINTDQYSGYYQNGNLLSYASTTNQATIFGLFAGGQNATTSATVRGTTAVGYQALTGLTTGAHNTALGYQAVFADNTNADNTGLGYQALKNSVADRNTGIGSQALTAVTSGSENTALGFSALAALQDATDNTAVGSQALATNVHGFDNVAVGWAALQNTNSSNNNTALGRGAGQGNLGSYSATDNTLVGYQSGNGLQSGASGNTFIGSQSGKNITTGAHNLIFGAFPNNASGITSGSNNILIGYDINEPSATASNQLNIGNLIYGTGVNGAGSTLSTGNIGIGTTSPAYKLDVAGPINVDKYSGYYQDSQLLGYASTSNQTTVFGLGAAGGVATTSNGSTIGVTAIGYHALNTLQGTFAVYSTAVGDQALARVTTGANNTGVGYQTLYTDFFGSDNTALGYQAGYGSNLSSKRNVAVGSLALGSFTSGDGDGNVALGYRTFASDTSVNNSIAIGNQAGDSAFGGGASYNILIGSYVTAPVISGTNSVGQLNIGNALYGTGLYNGTTVSSAPTSSSTIGVASTTPGATFAIHANNGSTNQNLFLVGSSTASATTTLFKLTNTGALTFGGYGAGTLQTDSSGNVTVSSDQRLKNVYATFDRGLSAIQGLQPELFHWNAISGLNQNDVNAGFIAQNVQQFIPEAVGQDSRGYLTLQDRPILAAAVNAIKQLATTTSQLSIATTSLSAQVADLQTRVAAPVQLPSTLAASVITTNSLTATGTIAAAQLSVAQTVDANALQVPAVPVSYQIGSTTVNVSLPSDVLAANGHADIYKLATYALAQTQLLASTTDALAARLSAAELRISSLEAAQASSTPSSGGLGTLTLAMLNSALSSTGAFFEQGIAHFTSIGFGDLVVEQDANGSSAAATSTIPAGKTEISIANPHAHADSQVFVTLTGPVAGNWYVKQKGEGFFVIDLTAAQSADVPFDYLIVQTAKHPQVATSQAAAAAAAAVPSGPQIIVTDGIVNITGTTVTPVTSAATTTQTVATTTTVASAPADTTPPVLTLYGNASVTIPQGGSWTDWGAKAVDNVDGDITAKIAVSGSVDTATPGTYTLTYSVADSAGNQAQTTRTITVTASTVATASTP